VGGGTQNIINSGNNSANMSFVGAGIENSINVANSFIGSGSNNTVFGAAGEIGGGSTNSIGNSTNGSIGGGVGNSLELALSAVIAGGGSNEISGYAQESGDSRVILGGYGNTMLSCVSCASQPAPLWAFVGGGNDNSAIGKGEVVEGGGGNVAKGQESTVPGGYHDLASGFMSFAAGFGAYALGDGSFVWADFSPGAPHLIATKPSSFLVRASGGVTFYSDATATTGVLLPAGSGLWTSVSDKALKTDIVPISNFAILSRFRKLKVSGWSYKSEPGVRHIGPMAQDFYKLFRVGNDDRHISTIDAGGVSLAAIKALDNESTALLRALISMDSLFARLHLSSYASLSNTFASYSRTGTNSRSSNSACSESSKGTFRANDQSNTTGASYSSILGGSFNAVCDDSSTIAAGTQNVVESGSDTGTFSFIGGGLSNGSASSEAFIGSGIDNAVSGGSAEAILGGTGNSIIGSAGSIILGGSGNSVTGGSSAVIGGGTGNIITAMNGQLLEVGGTFDSVIGGGFKNTIAALAPNGAAYSFLGGGDFNVINGSMAVVGSGSFNSASGLLSTVPGGDQNLAAGSFSFAAGDAASALSNGTFFYNAYDAAGGAMNVSIANSFVVKAPGGVSILSNAAGSVGVTLPPGSGSWSSASDRSLKVEISHVRAANVLKALSALPISEWSYRSENGVRHIGLMAQDFFSAFGLGEDDRHIASIDEDGVELAAIKAVDERDRSLLEEYNKLYSALGHVRQNSIGIEPHLQNGFASGVGLVTRDISASATCSGLGSNSFLASNAANVSAAAQSSVAGGMENMVCDDNSTIAGGVDNVVDSGNDSATLSFIGGGTDNVIASQEAVPISGGDGNERGVAPR
jgi:hypothetical protein